MDIKFETPDGKTLPYDCKDWLTIQSRNIAVFFGVSMLILVITVIAEKLIIKMSQWLKFLNKAQENTMIFGFLFTFTYIMTAVLLTFSNTFIETKVFNSDWYVKDGT